MISPDLKSLCVPVTNLTAMKNNPRKGDVEAVMRSYRQFGQRKPIVVRRTGIDDNGLSIGEVIAGNHQLKAAIALGWTEIAAVFTDDDDLTAKAFSLADNRTHDLGTYDENELSELLKELGDSNSELFLSTGYSANDLNTMLTVIAEGTAYDDKGEIRGELLQLANVSYGEPEELVEVNSVWKVGRHIMCVMDVMKDYDYYLQYLEQLDEPLFMPYPGPYIALSVKLQKRQALLIQPDPYLAGHIIDKYRAIYGADSVSQL